MTQTRIIFRTDYGTLQAASNVSTIVGAGGDLYDNILVHIPPVASDDFTAGPSGNSAAYNETVTVTKPTQILQGHGISTFITYDGEDADTITLDASDIWLMNMWVGNEDSTGTYHAVRVADQEAFLFGVECDEAGDACIALGDDTKNVIRCRVMGCTFQGTASKTVPPQVIGIKHDSTTAGRNIMVANLGNGLQGGMVDDDGFANCYVGQLSLNGGGFSGSDYNFNGNFHFGSANYSFSGDASFVHGGEHHVFSSSFSQASSGNAFTITDNFCNIHGNSKDAGGDGFHIDGQLNNITGVVEGSDGEGVVLDGNTNLITAVSNSNGGAGFDVNSSGNVILGQASNNTGNALNIASGSFTENAVFGRYRSDSAAGSVWWVGTDSLFCGISTGTAFALRNSGNSLIGAFNDGLTTTASADDSLLVGHVAGASSLNSGSNLKMFTQYGEHKRIRALTGDATLVLHDDYVTANTTSAGFTITLPSASGNFTQGKEYRIKNTGTGGNNLTVQSTTFADGETAVFVSNGSAWVDFS